MKLLLDSHVLIWMVYRPERLTAAVRDAVTDPANERFVSYAALWEISAKTSRGKLPEAGSSLRYILKELPALRIEPLRIRLRHLLVAEQLLPVHSDPFDRIQLAQAQSEKLTFVTADKECQKYGVPYLW
jgi:PIN domain nuclease of toxin-antitoxin system